MTEQQAVQAVVVTTERNAVLFGFIPAGTPTAVPEDRRITLADAQMCVYWSREVGGVVGLAASGPDSRSKVSRAAPEIAVESVTAVMRATGEAVKAWQARPWS